MSEKRYTTLYDKNGNPMTVPVRPALSEDDPKARYTGFCHEITILKKRKYSHERREAA